MYLENEDDEVHSEMETDNVSAADYLDDDLADTDEKENVLPHHLTSLHSDTLRSELPGSTTANRRVSSVRMGTKVSAHALTRERLRTVTSKDRDDLFNSSLHPPSSGICTISAPISDHSDDNEEDVNESLSMSLLERFDQMETEEGEPERRITNVTMEKDQLGRLGIKISGTPSGIYIDNIDASVARFVHGNMRKGDRIIAVNNRSLENVNYYSALDIIRSSGDKIDFLASQLRQ